MAAHCPAFGQDRCCSLASHAAGFLAMHYCRSQARRGDGRGEFSPVAGTPTGPVTTPYYANAGRGAADKVPQLWLYADNDKLYDEALIREYYQAFTAAGGPRAL